jgi:DNA-directed RNA polymerase subunit N (RpoN/RPB10)
MIIPVKCFTCGKVIGDKYRHYLAEVAKRKISSGSAPTETVYLTSDTVDKTPEAEVMDSIGLTRMCCRRHFLTHVDIE